MKQNEDYFRYAKTKKKINITENIVGVLMQKNTDTRKIYDYKQGKIIRHYMYNYFFLII